MVQCHLLLKERVEESAELDLYHGTHPAGEAVIRSTFEILKVLLLLLLAL